MYRALQRTGLDPLPEPLAEAVVRRVDAQAGDRRLAGALAALHRRDRDVLLLVAWAELTYEEVAAALDIPVGTVRSRNELGERTSIILDPETYAYLGTREDVARAHTWRPENGKPFTTEPGTVLSWYAELAQEVVDEPGSRS
ncbi:sigma factor-like helix-turn-helix DNA-binding protein [Actinomadura sp. 7K534]|uniref:RNA polymerase sigma factor n=1 Tax=Actinomadura sp. 7K534 TaxID=2530366 RepID=UPI0010497D0D|nr:hypothetical protein E1266_06500 [Actinomadura sp. 7K534]